MCMGVDTCQCVFKPAEVTPVALSVLCIHFPYMCTGWWLTPGMSTGVIKVCSHLVLQAHCT